MLILLPPSEGKAPTGTGKPLDLATLSLPTLRPARTKVLNALVTLCSHRADQEAARAVLGLSGGQADEVRRNAELRTAAAMPAGEVYTGVVYAALELPTLSPEAAALAHRSILIFSGLFGALRISDRIPPYRCSIGVNLPGVGTLGPFWRSALSEVVSEVAGDGLVLDLRSGAYATTWAPRIHHAARTASVRVLHERTAGGVTKRTVVSHFNKATKGRLVRELLTCGGIPGSPADLVTLLRDLKHTVEAEPPAAGKPWRIDLIVTEL